MAGPFYVPVCDCQALSPFGWRWAIISSQSFWEFVAIEHVINGVASLVHGEPGEGQWHAGVHGSEGVYDDTAAEGLHLQTRVVENCRCGIAGVGRNRPIDPPLPRQRPAENAE